MHTSLPVAHPFAVIDIFDDIMHLSGVILVVHKRTFASRASWASRASSLPIPNVRAIRRPAKFAAAFS